MSRIAPPALVLTDGGSGFATACTKVWPTTRVQRCTFHAYCRIRQYTTTRPKLEASQHLYALGQQLLHVEGREDAQEWIGAYQGWCTRWKRVSVRLCTGTDLQVCGEPVGVGHG